MSGWDLKEGEVKKNCLTDYELWEKHKKFFSKKTVMKTIYKILLYESLLESSVETDEINIFEIASIKFAQKYWDFKNNNNLKITMYNGKSYKSSQEIIIEKAKKDYNLKNINFNSLSYFAKLDYITETKRILKINVLGALYNDFNGTIYSFEKKTEKLVLNKYFLSFFKRNLYVLKKLNNYRMIELLKQLNKGNHDIESYFEKNHLELKEPLYLKIENQIEKFQNLEMNILK